MFLEWILPAVIAGFVFVIRNQVAIANRQARIEEKLDKIGRALLKQGASNLKLLGGAVEHHLRVPESERVFKAEDE